MKKFMVRLLLLMLIFSSVLFVFTGSSVSAIIPVEDDSLVFHWSFDDTAVDSVKGVDMSFLFMSHSVDTTIPAVTYDEGILNKAVHFGSNSNTGGFAGLTAALIS